MKYRLIIFLCVLGLLLPLSKVQAGTVLPAHQFAWSNNVGYINFGDVVINDRSLEGTAWSENKGFIIFGPPQGGVVNDGTGNLSGSAWGEQLGWIDFNRASITANGRFIGTATGPLVGTITFDCLNYCDVQTDWRPLATTPTLQPTVPPTTQPTVPPTTEPSQGGEVTPNVGDTNSGTVAPTPAADQAALFDVVASPVQSNQRSSVSAAAIPIIFGALLAFLILLAIYLIRRSIARAKSRERMRIIEEQKTQKAPELKP